MSRWSRNRQEDPVEPVIQAPRTPRERLWNHLLGLFWEPNIQLTAGPNFDLNGLTSDDVDRLWDRLRSSADPPDRTRTFWDDAMNRPVRFDEAFADGASSAARRCSHLLVRLDGVRTTTTVLPAIGVWVSPDAIGIFWWIGHDHDWNPNTVAGLAELLADLRALAPHASLSGEESASVGRLWTAIDEYIRAERADRSSDR